ncbi:MAG: AAA family ATPase [Methanomassiliicoccaceae archaeon]|nr:AAA family ATPase [Methanomassiliicoccaceae archaeon]
MLQRSGRTFKSVLVTGPRQVGKTTVLAETFKGIPQVTFDDKIQLRSAVSDPALFLRDNPPPVILDEVQYATALFPEIKMACDRSKEYGRYFLTGSQQYSLMENVSESLSGRVAIHELQGLSMREIKAVGFNRPFVPTEGYLAERKGSLAPYDDIWQRIHRGSNPELQNPDVDWSAYWSGYIQTYLERDVRRMVNVKDEMAFLTFLTALAVRTGQMLNYSAVADEAGKTVATIKEWTSVLRASGMVHLLQPYSSSALTRAVKTPKVYFRDTGLACYLARWLTPEALRAGAMNGNMFETFVVSEVLKSFSNAGRDHRFSVFYYRGKDKRRVRRDGVTESRESEIDMVIIEDGVLYPIEIKMSANPDASMADAFDVLDLDRTKARGRGTIICLYDRLASLREDLAAVPIEYV